MNPTVSNALLTRFSDFVAGHLGLSFPAGRFADLQRGVQTAAKEFGFAEANPCIEWLLSAPLTKQQIEILASVLTVGETYFFREKKTMEALEQQILPELIHSRWEDDRRLRLWSAGCSTGEEPYTLAILLHRLLPDRPRWNITILATDINPHFLHKAAVGEFGQWSFRDAPHGLQENYFTRTNSGRWKLRPDIKRMVSFSHLNLAEDVYPSLLNNTNAMDVILCRNVLMYFAPAKAERVIRNLHHSLLDGGWLIVGASETSQVLHPQLVTVQFPGTMVYRKDSTEQWVSRPAEQALEALPPFEPPQQPTVPDRWEVMEVQPVTEEVAPGEKPAAPTETPYSEALALYEQGRYAEATGRLLAGDHGASPEPRAVLLLARAFANRGKLADALTWCDLAVAADKLNPVGHYLRATILQEQGATQQASDSLHKALYLDPDFVLAHFDLANLALQQGRTEEARRHNANALRLLRRQRPDELVPESEGLTAGRLRELIEAQIKSEVLA